MKKKILKIKVKHTKEFLEGNDKIFVNPEAAVKAVNEQILSDYDLNGNGKLDNRELEKSKGYMLRTELKAFSIEDVSRITYDITKLIFIFDWEHQINNNHDDGFIIQDSKRRIARAIVIDKNISNNALRVLLGP